MKRFLLGWVIAFLAALNFAPAYADVNDFTIQNFHADYYLSRDSENRSTLKTVESITAIFPDYDQNHGIERAIPKTYDGHQVSLKIQSVNDENGVSINYRLIDDDNGNQVVRIGDADTYVHGTKNYVITYNQRDVTKYFSDTNSDEFYWDINGNSWSQTFEKISVSVHFDSTIAKNLTGKNACYYGAYGSNSQCGILDTNGVLTASTSGLGANQSMTIAVGFQPKTFAEYQKTAAEEFTDLCLGVYAILTIVAGVVSFGLMLYAIGLKMKYGKGAASSHAIVPEYIPPKDVDLLTSAILLKNNQKWVAALYVSLAIRGVIRIVESKEGIFNRSVYSIELMSTEKINDDERDILETLFNRDLSVGSIHIFKTNKPDYALYSKLKSIKKRVDARALADGYYEDIKPLNKKMIKIYTVLSILLIFMGISLIALVVVAVIGATIKPLSQKGRDHVDYLEGLKMYIQVAEEDRIKYLQSPQGAEKIKIDTSDNSAMVKLYEKLLPYAIMFDCEKEWSKVLGQYYETQESNPNWYYGNNMFNAVVFSSAISSFSSNAISNSYSAPTSSSSGGSGGGGFSGGGGGGGGGGGW